MSIFNKKGMLVFPNPKEKRTICNQEKLLVFTACYCPNGHNLVTENAKINEFNGILLEISDDENTGYVALSPVYGCKTRIAVGIKLQDGKQYKISCTECHVELPTYSECHCGAHIFALFLDKESSYHSFVGACNRIGCENSYIQIGEELITSARLQEL